MFTALFTFLGGATVRLLLGHAFDFITKWQDSKNEIAHLRLQGELDAAQHGRNLEAIKVQAELGVKVIEAQTESHVTQVEADAFVEAVKATGQKTGVFLVDLWNGVIRPFLATVCIALWISSLASRHFVLDDWDRSLMSLALGIFVGGRIHATGR
jgi:hypothetical protein